jgi:hypothetical protein
MMGVTAPSDFGRTDYRPRRAALHGEDVALALTLALRLMVAASDDCYVVTNTRILVVPCDIGPATIDELTEEPPPSKAATVQPQRAVGPAGRRNRASPRPQPVAPLGQQELERKLQDAEDQRITAVAERLAAEQARGRAIAQRDASRRELDDVQEQLAAARARIERLVRDAPRATDGRAEAREASRAKESP